LAGSQRASVAAGLAGQPAPGRRRPAAVLLLLAAFALLAAHGLLWDTPTVDEFAHLPAGCYYWQTGDFELFALNPPLVKLLSALPLLALHPTLDTGARIRNTGWYPWAFGTDFMERNRAAYDRIFLWGRLPVVLLGLLAGLLVHRWARELYGEEAGLLALALFAFCPSLVAHAHLATVDLGATVFLLLALYLFQRFVRRPGTGALLACGVALGLAQLAKFTALLLYPTFLLLAVVALALGERFPPLPATGRRARLLWSLGSVLAIFLLSVAVIDAGYLFQGVGRTVAGYRFESRLLGRAAALLPPRLPLPLPRPYLEGLDGLQLVNDLGEYPNYLFGRWSRDGWAGYYLVALLYKSPLPLLAAFALAPFARFRGARGQYFLWLPALVLLAAFSLLSRVEYGIRYVLPVLPLGMVYAGRLAPWARERGRAARTALLALLLLYPLSALLATPDTISYFNLLAAGEGDRILLDSNLDWGQGLKRVRAYMARAGLERIDLAYFGHVDPAIYGIRWQFPEPGRAGPVAVSANFLHGYPYVTYVNGRMLPIPPGAFAWIGRYRREADLGGGIFLYRIVR
jgi:4-amino-4-deoxy-L-arabinose transferase-like glycosyltransferase